MESKNIFKSKTFWFNILTLGLAVTNTLPVSPENALLITNGINIALRTITSQSVHFISDEGK